MWFYPGQAGTLTQGVEGVHDRPPGPGDDPNLEYRRIPGGQNVQLLYDLGSLALKAKGLLDSIPG